MTQTSLISIQKMHAVSKTPFSKLITSFQKYKNELESNANYLTKKFPTQSYSKIKQVLQQLNNNVQMVEDILKEQQHSKKQVDNNFKSNNKQLSIIEENLLLKRSFLSLYRKLNQKQKKIKELEEINFRLNRENQFCKMENKYLKQVQQIATQFQINLDIY